MPIFAKMAVSAAKQAESVAQKNHPLEVIIKDYGEILHPALYNEPRIPLAHAEEAARSLLACADSHTLNVLT